MAIVVVLTVALAASVLPARRAAAVDPMVALKQD
jgi:ABC-type lipoprotein release transport system permease subunit